MRVTISKMLKGFIEGYENKSAFCERFDVDPASVSRYLAGEGVSAAFIGRMLYATGLVFEKAFVIEEKD